ncbi:hypothetical protein [Virgibacillus proomii]|uniref:hypothetical protein n=1 Tax=Virgibacillus proomii TaxID=84407 RepID=UPI001C0F72D0|nr:hypothetical protein [Virgibacillus proomii]MBU5266266.1 hypothetical protein [Virgibacillus proomii]
MTNRETLLKILKNLKNLSWSTMDAPYHGVSAEQESAIYFSINKALEGTGITEQDVINGDYLELINKED